MTTTATSIHTGPTPPAQPALQETEGAARGHRAHPLEQTRHSIPQVANLGHVPGRRNPERERPEDDEAVLIAVPATVTHRSFRERPEDDEVVLTYTSEPACRRMR